ncbi:hypothetical protein JCM10450v2_002305 [Rhodotorula kratochvilovae]
MSDDEHYSDGEGEPVPTWQDYCDTVQIVVNEACAFANNAGRVTTIEDWGKTLMDRQAATRYANLSEYGREGVCASVRQALSILRNTAASASLVLPTTRTIFPETKTKRDGRAHRNLMQRQNRRAWREQQVEVGEPSGQHDLPSTATPAAPPQHRGYYHPGTYPSNPVPLTRPHDPSAPTPDAYQHARLARTNPAAPETEEQRLMRVRHGRDYYGGMNALGRRAARHYGTTPERWARGGAW